MRFAGEHNNFEAKAKVWAEMIDEDKVNNAF